MRILIEMPVERYDAFFDKCDPSWPELSILLRGEFVRRLNGDRYLRIVQIDCSMFHARRLLERAKQIYPDAVPDIEDALAMPHVS